MVQAVGNFQAQDVGDNAEQFGNLSDLGKKVSVVTGKILGRIRMKICTLR